jgi:hypothetical protein
MILKNRDKEKDKGRREELEGRERREEIGDEKK